MHITLIGMSNIGKSHWARRLAAECGFASIDCDLMIEERLAPELAAFGQRGTQGLSAWMGQPYDPQYADASRRYLELEGAAMRELIAVMKVQTAPPLAIASTGSVIHAGADIAESLRATSRVIYLEASDAYVEDMIRRYFIVPKPVVWDETFVPSPGEPPQEALARCYPALLRNRDRLYRAMAHEIIPYARHRDPAADARNLFGIPS